VKDYTYLWTNLKNKNDYVFFLLGDFPASEFYVQTFRNTLFHLHRSCKKKKNKNSVPKRRHIKFRRRGITQEKQY